MVSAIACAVVVQWWCSGGAELVLWCGGAVLVLHRAVLRHGDYWMVGVGRGWGGDAVMGWDGCDGM